MITQWMPAPTSVAAMTATVKDTIHGRPLFSFSSHAR
jgi:hypothetical protein